MNAPTIATHDDDAVARALLQATEAVLASEILLPVGTVRVNTQEFLLHCTAHLTYHLGQVDYHRRISTGSAVTLATMAPAELSSARVQ